MKEEGIAELAFANDEQIKRVRDRLRILGVDFDVMKHRLEADFTLDVENLNLEMIDKSLETINTSIDTSTGNFKDMNEGQKKLFMSMIKDYNTLLPLLNAIKTETDKTAQANKILSGTNEEVTDTNNETTTSTNILTDALNNAFIAANKRIETIKEEIKLNKQLLDSSFALGKGYKNAGNAGIAAAHAVISAKIQEAVINYMAKAMVGLSFPANLIVPALGAAMAGSLGSVLGNMKLPQFEQGGYVGGRPHSQGGTIIEAERGEFVMSRNATESIGLETLNQMNQTGGGAVNVSVTGNVLTQDFVEGELAESIKEAIRRGTDFGIDDHFHFFGKGVR
jgi:anti-sigma28 factor (negative regulator of flagellin synthesis)